MPSAKCLFAMAACVSGLVNAEVFKVTAQMSGHFKPDTLRAKVGDVIEFHFEAANHSVVSGDYHNACAPMNLGTGFFSGFFPTENKQSNKIFRIEVNDTEPMPFYSSQGMECAKGMIGIINPSNDKNLEEYKTRASSLSFGVSPGYEAYGGEIAPLGTASYIGQSDSPTTPAYSPHDTPVMTPLKPIGSPAANMTGEYQGMAYTAGASFLRVPIFLITAVAGSMMCVL